MRFPAYLRSVLIGPFVILAAQAAMAKPGDLDPTFGAGGVVNTTSTAQAFTSVTGLIRQPDGRLVVAGTASTQHSGALARFEINGALDANFGVGGVATIHIPNGAPTALLQQPDGKLVAAGISIAYDPVAPPQIHLALARYQSNGSPDLTFGNSGSVVNAAIETSDVSALLLQPDGKLIVVRARTRTRPRSSVGTTPTARSTPPLAAFARA